MKYDSLKDLLIIEIQDLYDAENQLIELLPKMEKETSSHELKDAFKEHWKQTKEEAARLKEVLTLLSVTFDNESCEVMQSLVKEAEKVIHSKKGKSPLKDAALIGAAQKIEHYKIASYGIARSHADNLELSQIVDLLQESLDEGAAADRKLTKLAEGGLFSTGINEKARGDAL